MRLISISRLAFESFAPCCLLPPAACKEHDCLLSPLPYDGTAIVGNVAGMQNAKVHTFDIIPMNTETYHTYDIMSTTSDSDCTVLMTMRMVPSSTYASMHAHQDLLRVVHSTLEEGARWQLQHAVHGQQHHRA